MNPIIRQDGLIPSYEISVNDLPPLVKQAFFDMYTHGKLANNKHLIYTYPLLITLEPGPWDTANNEIIREFCIAKGLQFAWCGDNNHALRLKVLRHTNVKEYILHNGVLITVEGTDFDDTKKMAALIKDSLPMTKVLENSETESPIVTELPEDETN